MSTLIIALGAVCWVAIAVDWYLTRPTPCTVPALCLACSSEYEAEIGDETGTCSSCERKSR